MPSERVQRQVELLLDEVEEASPRDDWPQSKRWLNERLLSGPGKVAAVAISKQSVASLPKAPPIPVILKANEHRSPGRRAQDRHRNAIAEFREIKMQASLERALRH